MQELDQYINKARHLPGPPRIVPQLLVLLNRPNAESSLVVRTIALDADLAARVLEVCNSAYFAAATPITDLHEGVTRLGFRQVYEMVAAVSGAKMLVPALPAYGFNAGELWRHSVMSAVAAQLIAARAREDVALAFTAAILHDMGKVVLDQFLAPSAGSLFSAVLDEKMPLLDAEKHLLQAQHAEIGGRLLERWNFPEPLVSSVWFHHQPAAARPHHRLAACLHLGNLAALHFGRGFGHFPFAVRARDESFEVLGLPPESWPEILLAVVEKLDLVKALEGASM